MSGWFEAAREREAVGDPYWLYALSNGGSLLALVAYPLLIEPRLGLGAQRGIWAVGYVLLVVLLAVAAARAHPGLRARFVSVDADVGAARARPSTATPPPYPSTGADASAGSLLAAVPSGLLSAVTMFIATDLVSAPLLWVAPLSLYLVSFIIAFSPRGQRWIGSCGDRGAGDDHASCGCPTARPAAGRSSRSSRWSWWRSASSRRRCMAGSPMTGPTRRA